MNNGKFQFVYDYRNRLIEVRKMGDQNDDKHSKNKTIRTKLITEFKYDVLGRRLAKTIYEDENEIKKTIGYTYSNNDAIEENEYKYDDGKEKLENVREYIYGKGIDDVIVVISSEVEKSKLKNTKMYFYQKNQLGSITAITDKDGKIVEEYRYDTFGKAYIRDGKSDNWREFNESKIGNSRLFTGREYDGETGLYYYRARYYSSELGRFISRDPIGTRDNVNLYSYVGNNPVGFVDAMGREKVLIQKFDVTDLVLTIFEIAKNGTESNIVDFIYNTQGGGAYDLKRNAYIQARALQNNGIVYFGGVAVEPSNLGNILAGFNMENSNLSNGTITSSFLLIEYDNATQEGYGPIDAMRIANADEYTDSIWYDVGINIHDDFISGDKDKKIELIKNALIANTPEYLRRSIEENTLRSILSH